MKIRNTLLISISYLSLSSLALADSSKAENEFIFTHNTHLDSQPQLLSSPILPQTPSEHRDFSAPISLALTDGSTASVASVCFITDAGNCGGNDFGNSPDGGSSGGSSSGGSSSSGLRMEALLAEVLPEAHLPAAETPVLLMTLGA